VPLAVAEIEDEAELIARSDRVRDLGGCMVFAPLCRIKGS